MEEKRVLVGIPEGKRPFRRPRHGWDGTVELYHKEMVLEDVGEVGYLPLAGIWEH
jgi:hypothetical protein